MNEHNMVSARLAWTLLNDAFRSISSSLEVATVSGESILAFMMQVKLILGLSARKIL